MQVVSTNVQYRNVYAPQSEALTQKDYIEFMNFSTHVRVLKG
jgi:hypothetical protein